MNSAIERLLTLRVTDIMTRRVVTVSPDQKMSDAARLLIEKRVTGAPVVDAEGRCVGILSATDYLHRHGGSDVEESSETFVHEHMSTEVKTISESETLTHAARRLCADHIHRLPVIAANNQIIGWVSSLDVVAAMINAIEE